MLTIVAIVALVAVTVLVAGCSGGGTGYTAPTGGTTSGGGSAATTPAGGGTGGSGTAAAGDAVTISGFAFNPTTLDVKVGSTVTWTNQDSVSHTVTADDGSFKSDPLPNGATFKHTFTKAGNVNYHCAIHTYMTATITVK
jgi:plastocyanin